VKYDEITRMVTASSPDDWTVLGDGPIYLDRFTQVHSGDRHWMEADSHYYLAVYQADVNLRLAWGITLDDKLSFEGWTWPDRSITRLLVDALWQGALVARWAVLSVDGGRCYLPNPRRDSSSSAPTVAWTAEASEIALARLLQRLTRPSDTDFARYLEQAGVVEVPTSRPLP
jgi:hypothetical protein